MSCENYDPCFPDQPVVDLYLPVWANQAAFKSKPAFVWADDSPRSTTWSSITYSQLDCSVQAIANSLLSHLHRGDTLLILCPPGLQLVKTLFACQRAGLVSVPIIPPTLSDLSSSEQSPAYHHLLRVLAQTNPKAAIADQHYVSKLAGLISKSNSQLHNFLCLSIDNLDELTFMDHNHRDHYSGCRPDDPYLIQYTSGATGLPKPVIVTAGSAAHNVRSARWAYDLQPSSVIVSWLPQYHDCGLMFLLLTVVSGATCVLTSPSSFLNRPRLWLELITEFKATCTPVPSFALPLVVRRGSIDKGRLQIKLDSLRNLILINEPIYKSIVEEFVNKFKGVGLNPSSISPSYGLAENCTFVSTAWRWTSPSYYMPEYKKLLPSARLAISPSSDREDFEIMVVNEETCKPVVDGVEGEVWVSSASNASGYLQHPCLTRKIFHGRLKGRSGPCFMRTGDRGVIMGEERYLYVIGRTLDVIKVEGLPNDVYPHYLEMAAYNSDTLHLRGGCIVAFGMLKTVILVAELQKRGGIVNVNHRKICEGIREKVIKEEGVRIGMVVLVESGSVPKTTSGKLRRFLAKDKLLKGRFPVVFMVEFQVFSISDDGSVGHNEDRGGVEGEALLLASLRPNRQPLQSFL